MPMISYAQNREDVLLRRVFPDNPTGFYIDVGAADPVTHSVTKHFYDRGWHGINIEPLPECFRRLQADRPRDLNLHVGLSSCAGLSTFYEMPSCPGWSTFSPSRAQEIRTAGGVLVERQLPVTTLASICAQHVRQIIDFLKIDVECQEKAVLAGGDWKTYRPRIILLEAPERFDNAGQDTTWDWESILLENDYLFAALDGLNRYYVRAEDRALLPRLRVPVNVLDDFVPYEYHYQIKASQEASLAIQEASKEVEALLHAALQKLVHARLDGLQAPAPWWKRMRRHCSTRFPRAAAAVRSLLRKAA